MSKFPSAIVAGQRSRGSDTFGSGRFGASRGGRKHQGLDIEALRGQQVFAPIPGIITREAVPYANDLRYKGVLLEGSGAWSGYTVKIFYVDGIKSGEVASGELIGYVQNLQIKYPGITNHIHVEVRFKGRVIDPFSIWQMCF